MTTLPGRAALLGACAATALVGAAYNRPAVAQDASEFKETEEGFPVTDKLTIEKCGACHTKDAKGNLSRISWTRATPEGWSQAIKRMVKLNGAVVTPDEAKSIVKYLASSHGLAPEEAKPVMYITERRVVDETNIPNDTVRNGCAACHALGIPLSSRRTKTEWKLLQNMHIALYSQAEAQFRRPAPTEPGATPPPSAAEGGPAQPITQGQVALDYVAKTAPLHSAEWASWQPRMRDPKLAGKWMVSATLPGKGRFIGEMTISPAKESDEFTTAITLRSLSGGQTFTRKGKGIVYAGYSWRGSSDSGVKPAVPDDINSADRETMFFAPDQKTAEGRWYWGTYHEFGFDVKLTRINADPAIAAVSAGSVKTGTKDLAVHIYGENLPTSLTVTDVDFGAGVTVKKVSSVSPTEAVATIDVAPNAVAGRRDVAIHGAVLQNALPVYSKIDYIKVTPETALAHLGGVKFPKGYGQFDAIGFANGADGKPGTADDVPLGQVDVTWSVEEFSTVTYDDDKSFVGTLSPAALFTPSVEGPNPQRRFSRNNYGEVWVVATAKNEKDSFGKPLSGRAYLVVTVPMYKMWDQPEVSQ